MFILISFFVFVLLVILLIFLFCNKKKKQNRNNMTNNQKVHFKFSIFENCYAEFDYETETNKSDNSNA